MPSGADPSTVRTVLRSAGIVVAIISAAIAVFLVVFSDASRSAQFGVLLGLWAALILALSMVRGHEPAALSEEEPAPAAEVALAAPAPTYEDLAAGMALELRRSAELERQNAEVERREFQLKLELMLRREVEHVLAAQLESLRQEIARLRGDIVDTVGAQLDPVRQEIAALRGEILDNVGGQLRLERIETTRLIGSDVQALQQEIRRLADVRFAMEQPSEVRVIESPDTPASEPEPRAAEAIEQLTSAKAPETSDAPEAVEAPEAGQATEAPEAPEAPNAVEPNAVEPNAVEPEPAPMAAPAAEPQAQPVSAVRRPFDFADLPSVSRLTPLPAKPPTTEGPRYSGRRRAAEENPETEVPPPRSGGQRRAPESPDEAHSRDDVLARLLGR